MSVRNRSALLEDPATGERVLAPFSEVEERPAGPEGGSGFTVEA